jgi:hypothetical protein
MIRSVHRDETSVTQTTCTAQSAFHCQLHPYDVQPDAALMKGTGNPQKCLDACRINSVNRLRKQTNVLSVRV